MQPLIPSSTGPQTPNGLTTSATYYKYTIPTLNESAIFRKRTRVYHSSYHPFYHTTPVTIVSTNKSEIVTFYPFENVSLPLCIRVYINVLATTGNKFNDTFVISTHQWVYKSRFWAGWELSYWLHVKVRNYITNFSWNVTGKRNLKESKPTLL